MHMQAGIAFAIFFTLGVRAFIEKLVVLQLLEVRQAFFYKNLLIDHMERLDRWQQLRPFIQHGYCTYARRLILEMIEAYEFLLSHHFESDREILYVLRRLLLEFPPDYDPPIPGGSLFVIKVIYARIVTLQKRFAGVV